MVRLVPRDRDLGPIDLAAPRIRLVRVPQRGEAPLEISVRTITPADLPLLKRLLAVLVGDDMEAHARAKTFTAEPPACL